MLGLRLHFFRVSLDFKLRLGLRFFNVSLGLTWSVLGGLNKREGVRGRAQRLPHNANKYGQHVSKAAAAEG